MSTLLTPAEATAPVTEPALVEDGLQPADLLALRLAIADLEHDSLATRLTGLLGRQVTALGRLIPAQMSEPVARATDMALRGALRVALGSLRGAPGDVRRSQRLHKAAAAVSGATGGLFGLASLPVELPISTGIMLRSIAEIARANGEDLAAPETALACLEVFALGSGPDGSALTEGGYFAARGLLAKSVSEAIRHLANRSALEEGAPALLRFLSQVAARFGVVVSQKVAAQGVPLLGAAGGGVINYAFAAHYQAVARGHFTVRRLERRYGAAQVRAAFAALAGAAEPQPDVARNQKPS